MRASSAFRRQILEGALRTGGAPRFTAVSTAAENARRNLHDMSKTVATSEAIADVIQNAIAEIQPILNELDEIVTMLREKPRAP